MPRISSAASNLARQHNSDNVETGWIYQVNLETGNINGLVATYACDQVRPGDDGYGKFAYLRISHGRLSAADAQRFIDQKGEGW